MGWCYVESPYPIYELLDEKESMPQAVALPCGGYIWVSPMKGRKGNLSHKKDIQTPSCLGAMLSFLFFLSFSLGGGGGGRGQWNDPLS